MSKRTVTMIDPSSGWQYGFPKVLPDGVENIHDWLVEEGLPKHLTTYPIRFWEEEVDDSERE